MSLPSSAKITSPGCIPAFAPGLSEITLVTNATSPLFCAWIPIQPLKNPHAVALGRLGGKGRIKKTTSEQRKEWARKGGLARAKRYPKKTLSKWAKKGGRPIDSGKKEKS
jgi:hypothetical protein